MRRRGSVSRRLLERRDHCAVEPRTLVAIVKDPARNQRLVQMDLIPIGTSAADFERIIREDTAKWAGVIRQTGIKPD
jgi:hypothetical protein